MKIRTDNRREFVELWISQFDTVQEAWEACTSASFQFGLADYLLPQDVATDARLAELIYRTVMTTRHMVPGLFSEPCIKAIDIAIKTISDRNNLRECADEIEELSDDLGMEEFIFINGLLRSCLPFVNEPSRFMRASECLASIERWMNDQTTEVAAKSFGTTLASHVRHLFPYNPAAACAN